MAVKAAVTLRLGAEGDEKIREALRQIGQAGNDAFAGLSREAKEAARSFDRLEKSLDVTARSSTQVARAYVSANNAVAAGVRTQADAQRVVDLAVERHRRLTGVMTDNAKATGLARHEWINLSRQFQDVGVSLAGGQSPTLVLLQQGSQIADIFSSSGSGAGAALRSFGATAVRALFSPIGAATALAAAIAGVGYEAGAAQEKLARLGEQSRLTGLPADILQGAKAVGAGAGLDEKAALGAFGAAAREFQAYGRNEGAVKSTLEKIDKGFLDVVDRARSAGEFIDILNEKIRSLPTAQAEQLARALYQDEGGAKLVDAIKRGEVSMRSLLEASGSTGNSLNQAAGAADDMQKRIAQAAQEADNKLLNAFKNIKSPTDDIKLGWYGVVSAMADAVEKSERLQRALNAMTSWSALFKEIGAAYDKVDRMLGARPVVRLEDETRAAAPANAFRFSDTFYDDKRRLFPQLVNAPVGDTRKVFTSSAGRKGKSDAERSAEKFSGVESDLQNKIALASVAAEGAEHDKIALKIKVENEQRRIGVGATLEQKDRVAELVTQLDAAERAQKEATKAAEAWRDSLREVGDIAREAFSSLANDLRNSKSAGDAFKSVLDQIERKVIDIAARSLTDSLFGKSGDKSSGGGGLLGSLFGSGADLLGGLLGGGKSSLFSGAFKFAFPGFPDGGLVGAPPRHVFSAPISAFRGAPHFADGGAVPAFLHAGEIVLNAAQQKNVAGQMGGAPKVIVQNFAPGVDIAQQVTPQGVVLTVQSMLQDFSKQIPGILADQRNRSN
ncbi:MAG: phage tail length tape measure family protein [Methylocystis sp.]|uniref:phage tail length tape measure family protein n=1 Tax=Methylocystis sp. TaxID=1911079 RepID=UPI003D107E46